MQNKPIINIAASIILNTDGKLLLVRKQNSLYFMQAGGKIEKDETPSEAVVREIQEELGLDLTESDFKYIGLFSAPAANEKDHIVQAHLFMVTIASIKVKPHAELAQTDWFTIEQAKNMQLAPLTENIILPIVEQVLS